MTTVQIIANPAITIGRMFSATFAGIAPASAPGFIAAQLIGGVLAIVLIRVLYPGITPAQAADAVIPHTSDPQDRPSAASSATAGALPERPLHDRYPARAVRPRP
ncbi:MAG: aquaporin [Actinomycetota bacterium]|nr:aquaporin [Actinomycetota bacterium]